MGTLIAGNPEGARLQYSSSLATSMRRGRFWDEPVSDGILYRLVDLTIEQPGWLRISQPANVNISCLSAGDFASSFFRHGDANSAGASLRVFTLRERHHQIVTFKRPTLYRVVQLSIAPERVTKILTDLGRDPMATLQAMERACHSGNSFTVCNFPLPHRINEIANDLLYGAHPLPGRRLTLFAKAVEIFGMTLDTIVGSKFPTDKRQKTIACVEIAAHLLAGNITSPLDLDGLAKRVQLGPDTLERHFRLYLGMSPRSYLTKCRMREADYLLRSTNLNVAEVGRLVGFASHSAFARAYSRFFGRTPSSTTTSNPIGIRNLCTIDRGIRAASQ